MTTVLSTLFLLLVSPPVAASGPPVRIWLSSDATIAFGVPERVYVETSTDGNLVVLHARADGKVEMLFPASPTSNPFVRAGTYEIRGPTGGAAFAAPETEGRGTVIAALSPDPMWFDEFVHNGTWNVAAIGGADGATNPEALLTDVVQRMLGDGSFNYDVVTYNVGASSATVIADVPVTAVEPLVVCIQCPFLQADRLFRHHRRGAPAVTPAPPARAAIAVYSVHRPGVAMEPMNVPTDPLPLDSRPWPPAERPNAAMRSRLLSRRIHAWRSNEPAVQTVVVPVSPIVTAGLAPVTTPTPAPASVVVPETQRPARTWERPDVPRSGTVPPAPAAARAGVSAPTGVGPEAGHTAGWRHPQPVIR
jgi:hypothetical protein